MKQVKGIKGERVRNENIRALLFIHDSVIYNKDPKTSTRIRNSK